MRSSDSLEFWETLAAIVGEERARRVLEALGGAHMPTWKTVERALQHREFLEMHRRLTAGQLSQRLHVPLETAKRWIRTAHSPTPAELEDLFRAEQDRDAS